MARRIGAMIVAPHPDDEVLWAYHFLTCTHYGERRVVLLSNGGRTDAPEISKEIWKALGVEGRAEHFVDRRFYESIEELHMLLQSEVERYRPSRLIYPGPSTHQDHRVVQDICRSFLRPGFEFIRVAYEYGYWTTNGGDGMTCVGEIDSVEGKMRVAGKYGLGPVQIEALRRIAEYHGGEPYRIAKAVLAWG
ncbi:MAG: PIG-L family deacetylase [bacterium]